jgi:multiple sugar transport system permease protein
LTAATPGRRHHPWYRREMRASWFAFFMNVPTIAFLLVVLAYPIGYAGYLSLHRVRLADLRRGVFNFTGLENYSQVLNDPLFWVAIKNTAIFTAVTVTSEVVLAVLIALLINQTSVWTSRVTRFLILLPYAIPPIANGLIWTFLYSFQFGFLNRILLSLGLVHDRINWSGEPSTALYAVAVPYIWRTLPFAIILVHAALQGIPKELYEQASVDGARAWHRFWHITLPMLRQILAIILVLRTAFAFAVFEEILAITQGGPGDATWVAAWYSYKVTFAPPNNFGMGAASAYILAAMICVMAIVYMRTIYRRVTL